MKVIWKIDQKEIDRIRDFVNDQSNAFIDQRISRNVNREGLVVNKNEILRTLVMCLLTSQQRSGPNSLVGQFLLHHPYAFTVEGLRNIENKRKYVVKVLVENNLKRYVNNIADYFVTNFEWLEADLWGTMNRELEKLAAPAKKEVERKAAIVLANHLKGIGPKQARNFLQSLGLTRYEIPIDSRITHWLNDIGFPVTLSSATLQDHGYYNFVSDGFQEICKQAKIYPCVLDAAIFSSFDNGEWSKDNLIY